MKHLPSHARLASALALGLAVFSGSALAAPYQVIGWSDSGLERMDSDYSVFSLWPPGNTIHAQIIYQGKRLTNTTGISVTYQAVADPGGSINSTSAGKTEFWDFVLPLFGTNPPVDVGLSGTPMPGSTNKLMVFNSTNAWFTADNIPITPYDDALRKKPYPLMRLIARTNTTALATNDVVLPISDEVNCRVCHASGTTAAAQPAAGWAWNANPEHDYRLNILRLHDQLRNPATWPGVLSSNGYNPAGLYVTATADAQPILCVRCHKSTLVPGSGFGSTKPLTTAIHGQHATVLDPLTGAALNNSTDRSGCYYCHPGATSHGLRGPMGDAVSTNGTYAIHCQRCHGNLSFLAATNRTGWIDLPDCQSCHSGTATSNNGQIRYTSAFASNGVYRIAVNQTFATSTNAAFGNYSTFRYSTNHGRLFCAGCHGAAHAEFPADRNDNLRVIRVQGHEGMLSSCTDCHNGNPPVPNNDLGGPHTLHAFGQNWVNTHMDPNWTLTTDCQPCHGVDDRGTVLSEVRVDRSVTTPWGTKNWFKGTRIGCWTCHRGPVNRAAQTIGPAVVSNVSTNTTTPSPVAMVLPAQNTNTSVQTVTVRIISQPLHGKVGLTNAVATYYPDPGYVGTDTFTWAAWNNNMDSRLATGTVTVAQGPYSIGAQAQVPPTFPAGWPAPFTVTATPTNAAGAITYDWNFGDATPHSTNRFASHTYAVPGTYNWSVVSTVQGTPSASATNSGSIVIGGQVLLSAVNGGPSVTL